MTLATTEETGTTANPSDVTEATVYRLASEGKFPALHVGRLIRLEWAAVLEAMAAKHERRA